MYFPELVSQMELAERCGAFHVLSGVAKFSANQEVTTHLRTVEVSALIAHCISLQRQNGKIQQTYVVLQCTGILIPDNHLWLRINASVKR